MGCACRKKNKTTSAPQKVKKSPSTVKVGRATPRVPVTKRLPRGTRVRQ